MVRILKGIAQALLSGLGAIVLLALLTAGVCAAFRRGFRADQAENDNPDAALC